ncbi:MAG: hypothetical protein AABY84_12530 [Candidatus Firestonebacteria bacterium]|mgnify:CR=1 FL=1
MKKVLLFATVLVCVFQMNVFGQEQMGGRNFGLGLELGDYSGVTAKIWTTDINALSMGIGFGPFTRVHLDYLWHNFNVIKVDEGRLPLYYGFGGIINTANNVSTNFGIRGTIGMCYIFKNNNFDIFFELSPTLRFNPSSGLFLSGAIGGRYFF